MSLFQNEQEFESLLDYLKNARGFDFGGYKRSTLMRRVSKCMKEVGAETYGEYVDFLEVRPEEFSRLFNTILINVTAFFRDPEAWNYLAADIVPRIVAGKREDEPIRIWSVGCASGEEAYTLVMVFAEAMGPDALAERVKIYATDVDEAALAQARQATYGAKDLEPVPAELRDKYFQATNGRYVFNNLLRRGVIFGRHDLVQDAPISRLDLLVCRNTIMYLNAETQGRVLARLHFALSDEGFIFLGRAEMLLTHTDLFTPLNSRHRIFVKVPRANLRDRLLVLAEAGNQEARNHLARYVTLRELALEASPLAQIVVDRGGNLTLANEAARTLLGIDPKDLGRSFRDLEARYRPVAFREYIQQAEADRGPVTVGNVEHALPDGAMKYLDVRITPLVDNGGDARGFSITFLDVTRTTELQSDLHRSSQDLETAYEELQSTNEELETSNEELQSTVEELETTNEELQSSNEELETMNEELQSTNEELQAINEQLRGRTEELRRAKSFLESVLSSLSLGVVVVDGHLAIREWNHKAEDLWGLRSDEVEGQSLLHLDIGLPVEKLKEPMRACLDGAGERQEIVLEATNRRGQALRCRISFSPLLGLDSKKREGVILLMDEKGRSLPGRKSSG